MTTGEAGRRIVGGYKHGQVPREVREQQLLDMAEQLFIEKGYEAASIEDLARAAGVTRPVVYGHFGSKQGLFLACLQRIRGEFENALIEGATQATDLHGQLERGADAFFATLERDPRRWALVYGGATLLLGPIAEELAALRLSTVERIADLIRLQAPDADPERLAAFAHGVSAVGEQLGRWWLANPDIPRARVVAYHRDFCFAAIRDLIDRPPAKS